MYRLELGTLLGMPAMGGYSRSPRLDVRLNCLTARAASVRRYGPAAATVGRPKILTIRIEADQTTHQRVSQSLHTGTNGTILPSTA